LGGQGLSGLRLNEGLGGDCLRVGGLFSHLSGKVMGIARLPSHLLYLRAGFVDHLIHLPARFNTRVPKFDVLKITDDRQYESEESYNCRGQSSTPSSPISGAFWLGLGYWFVCKADSLIDEPSPTLKNKFLCFGIFACAAASIFHGTILFLGVPVGRL
jgi:hypothetical protein